MGWEGGVVLSPPECLELRVLFFFKYIYIYYFFSFKKIFGHAGSSLPCAGFSLVAESGVTLQLCPPASHCGGLRHCAARALSTQASVAVARGLSSYILWALERGHSRCGSWA